MKPKVKQLFANFYAFLKSTEFKDIMLKDILISLIFVPAYFVPAITWVIVGILVGFVIIERNVSSIMHILFVSSALINELSMLIVIGIFVLVNIVKLLIQVVKKEKKLNFGFIIIGIVIYLFVVVFAESRLHFTLKFGVYFLLLYIIYENSKAINKNACIKSFVYGLIVLCVLSVFTFIRPDNFIMHGNLYRFQAFSTNPNVLYKFSLIATSLICVLFAQKQIKPLNFYLTFFILNCITILTLSKAVLVFNLFLNIMLIIYLLIKKQWKSLAIISLVILLITIVTIPAIKITLSRFSGPFVNIDDGTFDNLEDGGLNSITTGRSDLWTYYLKDIFSDVKIALCGHGYGHHDSTVYYGPHSTILQVIYCTGIIGFVLIAVPVCLFMFYKKWNWKKVFNLLPLGNMLFCLLVEDVFFIPYSILWLILVSLVYWEEENIKYDS